MPVRTRAADRKGIAMSKTAPAKKGAVKVTKKTASRSVTAAAKKVTKKRATTASKKPGANTALDLAAIEESFAQLLALLSPKKRDFAAAASEVALVYCKALFDNEHTKPEDRRLGGVAEGIATALGSDVLCIDWKVTDGDFIKTIAGYLRRKRGVKMDVAPLLAEFAPAELSDQVMQYSSEMVRAIANQASGVALVRFGMEGDTYGFGFVATSDLDAFEGLLRALSLDEGRNPVLTALRPAGAPDRTKAGTAKPATRPAKQAGQRDMDPETSAKYWPKAVKALASNGGWVEGSEWENGTEALHAIEECAFRDLLLCYSRGDEIGEIARRGRQLFAHDMPRLLAKLPPPPGAWKIGRTWGTTFFSINQGGATEIRFASMLVLCKPTRAEAQAFADVYQRSNEGPDGLDLIIKALLQRLGAPMKRRAKSLKWPRAYQLLWDAIDPKTRDADRPKLIKRFLKQWLPLMQRSGQAETLAAVWNHTYVGYWCLEAAAVVVAFGIDDTLFRDDMYYPRDFADWARA
jgi:hypothetical protein